MYDVRRNMDMINIGSCPDIMVMSSETGLDAHPYWYACIIGVFYALVSLSHTGVGERLMHRMDFLWVRWFGIEPGRYRYGICYAQLPKIGFVESTNKYAFTFLNPAQAIRGMHIFPAFSEGQTLALLPNGKSVARILNPDEDDDWVNFYVNM